MLKKVLKTFGSIENLPLLCIRFRADKWCMEYATKG